MTAQPTDLTWRTIAEFTLPAVTDSARTAATQVASAVRDLNLAPGPLEQLTSSVSEAVQKAILQGRHVQADVPLQIRVSASALADSHTTCCWGFFLITRATDRLDETGDPAHYAIEVFLYQERASETGFLHSK